MKLHSDSHGMKRPIGRLASPHSLSQPTHHHASSSFICILYSPPSPEYDMVVGLASQLWAHMIQPQTYGCHYSRALQTFYRWKRTNRPYADLLPILGMGILYLFVFLVEFTIFSTVFIPLFRMTFPTCCFFKPNWKRKKRKKKKIWLHNYRSTLPWCSNHLEQKLAYLGILCNISQRAVLGTCFPQISPSVTAFLESDDLKAIILYLGYQQMQKSGK